MSFCLFQNQWLVMKLVKYEITRDLVRYKISCFCLSAHVFMWTRACKLENCFNLFIFKLFIHSNSLFCACVCLFFLFFLLIVCSPARLILCISKLTTTRHRRHTIRCSMHLFPSLYFFYFKNKVNPEANRIAPFTIKECPRKDVENPHCCITPASL